MTWYEATRHSFVSRHLANGASLDEVSAAVGHSSPVVTKRFYDHFIRRSFSPRLRAGLGEQAIGRVVPILVVPTVHVVRRRRSAHRADRQDRDERGRHQLDGTGLGHALVQALRKLVRRRAVRG